MRRSSDPSSTRSGEAIPIEAVRGIRSEPGRIVGLRVLKLDIVFIDDSTLGLDVPLEHIKKGNEVMEALAKRTALLPPIAGVVGPDGSR